jgi:hypothetical protein
MKAPTTKPRRRANLAAYHRTIIVQQVIIAAATIATLAALIGWLFSL